METQSAIIYAPSHRRAMDWSLVLASQGIETWLDRTEEGRWALVVHPHEEERALNAIRLYQFENRHWNWSKQLPRTSVSFHTGVFLWTFALVLIHQIVTGWSPALGKAWEMDSARVQAGESWRLFTAVGLHADLSHLMANLTVGTLFLGIAMSRFGAGFALLAAFLAGASGNLAGLLLYPDPYRGLGASGMVMGALGLVTVQSFSSRFWSLSSRVWLRALLAGVMLFVLLGLNPSSDIIAHLGGFLAGLAFGLLFILGLERFSGPWVSRLGWLVFLVLLLATAGRGLQFLFP